MARLNDLPNEILLQIFWHLTPEGAPWYQDEDRAFLYNLSLTCRRLTPLVQPLLFKNVYFYPQEDDVERRRFSQFCSQISKTPSLGAYVCALTFAFDLEDKSPFIPKACQRKMINLIENLPKLKSLVFSQHTGFGGHHRARQGGFVLTLISQCLAQTRSQFLETVELLGQCFGNQPVIAQVMATESVKSMRISPLFFNLTEASSGSTNSTFPWLENLSVEAYRAHAGDLHRLLSMTTGLKKLSLNWPTYCGGEELSPKKVQTSLDPIFANLVDLIIGGRGHFYPYTDGSLLDLKRFTSLKRVSLPSAYLFTTPTPHASRDELYKILPSSLEELTVIFENDSRVVEFDIAKKKPPRSEYSWILELAHRKPSNFVNLNTLKLEWNGSLARNCDDEWTDYFVCWEVPEGYMRESLQCEVKDESGELVDSWVNSKKRRVPRTLASSLAAAKIKFFAQLYVGEGAKGAISIRK